MKKYLLLLFSFTIITTLVCKTVEKKASNTDTNKPREPNQVMLDRARWLQGIIIDLPDKRYHGIARHANDLAAQTRKTAESLEGEKKEITLKISALALATAEAAKSRDNIMIKNNFTGIQAACDTCHAKYRK